MRQLKHRLGRTTRAILFASAALLVMIASVRADDDDTQYNGKEFELAIKRSVKENVDTKIKTSKGPVLAVKNLEWIDTGQWKVFINGAWGTDSNRIQILTYPGIMVNHGDRFEYVFYGQPVPEHLVQGIRNHNGMLKAEKAWKKKYKDVSFDVGVDGNRITLKVAGSYANGLKERHLVERMKYIWGASSGIVVWTYHASDDVEKAFNKELNGRKLTHLSRGEFELLVEDGLGEYFDSDGDAEEGNWFFNYKERPVYIANHGDRIVFNYHYDIPEEVAGAKRQNVLDEIKEFVEKNKIKLASSRDVTWYDEEQEDAVWLTVVFELDGSFKGEEFKRAYFEYYEKYTEKLEKAVEKAIDKNS